MDLKSLLLVASLAVIAIPARAEAEIAIQTGVRLGETDSVVPVFALTGDFDLRPEKWITALWSFQDTELRENELLPDSDQLDVGIHYLHAGGVYRPNPGHGTQGFVMVTGGLTWVDPQRSSFGDEFGLSFMIGGGAIVPLSERLGLRFDGRAYLTLNSMTLSGVCGGVGCSVNFAGDGALQFEGLIGLSIGL